MDAFQPGWRLAAPGTRPKSYSIQLRPQVAIQVCPVPGDSGNLDLITINSQTTIDPSTGVAIQIPPDHTPYINWGARAELLSGDRSSDPFRMQYCERRFQEGIKIAQVASSILRCQINGKEVTIDSLSDLDRFRPGWQNSTGTPTRVALAGHNLLALSPVPNSADISIVVDFVRNSPVPTLSGDFLQVPKEDLEVFYDYCVHLGMFKKGGEQFAATIPLYERFVQSALSYNTRLRTNAILFNELMGKAAKESKDRPIRKGEGEES